uniref:style cell-cycle inhibitor 1-A n=1 Tax=Erigeron canadensis TaxID=72917 RepID=UPI001CB95CDB|nr:style cell-cycle inhibitor 1-A [Erigeron canadensis]
MASDRKSKKKRSSSPSSEDDEKKRKRHKSSEPKPDKKDKHSTHKSHKSHKEGMPEEKHKRKHKLHKHDRREIANFKELSDADYFSKNNEFSTWLKDERDTFFSDLSSESARKLFAKFVKSWNNKKLDSKYYDGIVVGKRSSHNWKIKVDAKGDPRRHTESNRDI